jgi:hypothetical protein
MVRCIFYFVPKRLLELDIDYKDTVRDIKRKIYLEDGIPEEVITLVYVRQNKRALEEYHKKKLKAQEEARRLLLEQEQEKEKGIKKPKK